MSSILAGRTVIVTGGTGSWGHAFARYALALQHGPRKLIVFSRDELKQSEMRQRFPDQRMRWLIGDIRDAQRLRLAFRGVDIVFHAAAMKRVDACENDPSEAIATNVLGSQNVVHAALENQVSRTLFLSSDKACAPLNTYGTTKACAERLFAAASVYAGDAPVRFGVVRYGNAMGSRGSVVPIWRRAVEDGEPLVVNDPNASRFWFTLPGAVDLAVSAITEMRGGELYVPRLPSFRVLDLALAMSASVKYGTLRDGDKRAEAMVSADEASAFRSYQNRYVRFLPGQERGDVLPEGFSYTSQNNDRWLGVSELREALRAV